jgi:hypothetical protein
MILIIYQGMLGLKIRKSDAPPIQIIKRHRKTGPVAVILGSAGFFAGMIITFLDVGHIFKYPFHFINGLLIVSALLTTYHISKKIKGPEKIWRNRHFTLGILIIVLYIGQVLLGISMVK